MSDWKENMFGKIPCKPFDMVDVWFRDGGLSSGFASDFYWKIDHDIADIIKYKVRYNKTETPEEKEAFDSMSNNSELPNGSEWKYGDKAEWTGVEFIYVAQHPAKPERSVCIHSDHGSAYSILTSELKNPETPQQREERERLEAAYDLYLEHQNSRSLKACSFASFKTQNDRRRNAWMAIVGKTGYRKAK